MNLSQEQQSAAFTKSKNALCLAGAGSGKTRVIIGRSEFLIQSKNVSPYELIIITFTRKAAGELRERLEKQMGSKAHNITIGTFHSVALKMIQRFGEFINLNPGKITVYSSWEESVLLKDVAIELGYHTGKQFKGVTKKDVEKAFHLFYTRKMKDEYNYTANEIMEAFFLRCRENNALTYGMIMTSFLDLIPIIGHMLKFKHILVDEVQDNDPIQFRIVRLIQSICDASLFIVGDDSQSIYGFRGADPAYLVRNQDKFDIYKLADNYRSDGYIVESANRLIVHNVNRLDLEMNPIRTKLFRVSHIKNINSQGIVDEIKMTSDLLNHEKSCILARNHFLLEKLSLLLTQSGIDHDYIGKKTAFTRSEEFRRVHALLNLAINPFDNFSFMLCLDYFQIDREQYKAIRMQAVKEDKSHFQVLREIENIAWIIDYFDAIDSKKFYDVFDWMMGVNFGFETGDIFEFIDDWINSHHEPSIQEYLDWLALFDVQDEMVGDPKKLQLMTIHASKGLEFDMVIIAGLNEGILPSYRANNNPDELEAERRLAYVAYTRAKDFLILTSRPPTPEGKLQYLPSRFIKESLWNC